MYQKNGKPFLLKLSKGNRVATHSGNSGNFQIISKIRETQGKPGNFDFF